MEKDSKISSKLCSKCYKKLGAFHNFKSLALKSDAYLKSLDIKNEIFIREEDIKIKSEIELPIHEDSTEVLVKEEFPNGDDGLSWKPEEHADSNFESDDEFLSAVKKIKYEYISEEAKENGMDLYYNQQI